MLFWTKAYHAVSFLMSMHYGCYLVGLLAAVVLAVAAVLVRNVGDPSSQAPRRTTSIVLLLFSLVVLVLDASLFLVRVGRWGYLLAFLPGIAIARHAVYMRLIRRRALSAPVPRPPGLGASEKEGNREGTLEAQNPELLEVFARARQMHDRDFAPDTLVARFGIPALLTTFVGIGVFEFLLWAAPRTVVPTLPTTFPGIGVFEFLLWTAPNTAVPTLPWQAIHAAWFGAAGSMVYVLLYLGQRAFRNDITSGAALWSAFVLALGPVFGAVAYYLWGGDPNAGASVTRDALYFVVGMTPRHAASAVEEAVRRLWLARAPAPQTQSRLQPLAQLRGVTPAIEDRLAEEGIADIQGMAMADPLKLLRSTSFDKRQILSWMDEALLMTWLPEQWSALQKVGVTGAIDLMAHVQQRKDDLSAVLSSAAHLDPAAVDAVILVGSILKEDTQLRLVWALYQFDADGVDEPAADPGPAEATTPLSGLAPPALGWFLGGLTLALVAWAVGGSTVPVEHVLMVGGFLVTAAAVAITVRWPWANSRWRPLPLLLALLTSGVTLALYRMVAPPHSDDWTWALRSIFGAAAAACFGVFVIGAVTAAVGCALTVDFPNGAPAGTELWVGERPVDCRSANNAGTCRVAARRTELTLKCPGREPRRQSLDLRGQRSARVTFGLPAQLILQPDPPEARVLRLWVDGVETSVAPLLVAPRGVPYVIIGEAGGFSPAHAQILVTAADAISVPLSFRPRPPAAAGAPPQSPPIPVDPQSVAVVHAGTGPTNAAGDDAGQKADPGSGTGGPGKGP
jgi:hypothetical protein